MTAFADFTRYNSCVGSTQAPSLLNDLISGPLLLSLLPQPTEQDQLFRCYEFDNPEPEQELYWELALLTQGYT